MTRVLVIGYGNTLRGDDGFGRRAAERLRAIFDDPRIEVLSLHQLTPELMEPVSRAERVIFLDAAAGPVPGEIAATEIGPLDEPGGFTHFSTPGGLLAGALALYGTAPKALLITVTGANFELGETLSQPVEHALQTLVDSRFRPWIP